MATLIALTLVHSGNHTERRLYADDPVGRRRSAHHAMKSAIGGAAVLRQRGKSFDGKTFEGQSDVVYIPAAHQAAG